MPQFGRLLYRMETQEWGRKRCCVVRQVETPLPRQHPTPPLVGLLGRHAARLLEDTDQPEAVVDLLGSHPGDVVLDAGQIHGNGIIRRVETRAIGLNIDIGSPQAQAENAREAHHDEAHVRLHSPEA